MVATWKTQAAPTFDAALRAAQAANESMVKGREAMTTGLGEVLDAPGDAIMNRAKTELMNLDTDQAREQYLLDNPSSFHDATALSTFREGLLKTDVNRKEEGDRLKVLDQSNFLEQFNDDPDKQAQALSKIQRKNAVTGIIDKDKVLSARTDLLISAKTIEITPQSIKEAGGELGPDGQPVEDSLDPHVMEQLSQANIKKLKKQFYGASDSVIQEKNRQAFANSKYGVQFARRGKTVTEMSSIDHQARGHGGNIADALFSGDQVALEKAVLAANKWQTENPKISREQKGFIQAPLLQALDNFTTGEIGPNGQPLKLDAKTEWDKVIGVGPEATGSVANQNKFGRHMTALYRSKHKFLSQEVIDKQIAKIIDDSDNLRNLFDKGQLMAKYKTELHVEYMEGVKGVKKDIYNLHNRFRTSSVAAVIAKDLEAILNKTMEGVEDSDGKIRGKIGADLTRNVRNTYNNIKGLFLNKEGTPETNPNYGTSKLSQTQQGTLNIAVHRMLTAYGGINKRWGWIPWNDPEFTIKVLDGNDMDTATPMELMELVKEFLPPVRDRGEKARKGGELLERKIAQVQKGLTGVDAATPNTDVQLQKKAAEGTKEYNKGFLRTIFDSQEKYNAALKLWEKGHDKPMLWYDPVTWGPWLLGQYKGSAEEDTIRSMFGFAPRPKKK